MNYASSPIWLGAVLLILGLPGNATLAQTIPARPHAAVCSDEPPGTFHCTARVIVNDRGRPLVLPWQRNNSTMTRPTARRNSSRPKTY